jgi:1-acyl-sn-glycerol-3-phosphate acyltransferase
MLTRVYHSPLEIVVTGEHEAMTADGFLILIANHQIYTDWWYVWLLSFFKGTTGTHSLLIQDSSLP